MQINLETKQVSGAHSVTIDDFEPAVQVGCACSGSALVCSRFPSTPRPARTGTRTRTWYPIWSAAAYSMFFAFARALLPDSFPSSVTTTENATATFYVGAVLAHRKLSNATRSFGEARWMYMAWSAPAAVSTACLSMTGQRTCILPRRRSRGTTRCSTSRAASMRACTT